MSFLELNRTLGMHEPVHVPTYGIRRVQPLPPVIGARDGSFTMFRPPAPRWDLSPPVLPVAQWTPQTGVQLPPPGRAIERF